MLAKWEETVSSGAVTHLVAEDHRGGETEMSKESAAVLLKALRTAPLALVERLGNPSPGGGMQVLDYDKSETLLFWVAYDGGNMLTVAFPGEETSYVF